MEESFKKSDELSNVIKTYEEIRNKIKELKKVKKSLSNEIEEELENLDLNKCKVSNELGTFNVSKINTKRDYLDKKKVKKRLGDEYGNFVNTKKYSYIRVSETKESKKNEATKKLRKLMREEKKKLSNMRK